MYLPTALVKQALKRWRYQRYRFQNSFCQWICANIWRQWYMTFVKFYTFKRNRLKNSTVVNISTTHGTSSGAGCMLFLFILPRTVSNSWRLRFVDRFELYIVWNKNVKKNKVRLNWAWYEAVCRYRIFPLFNQYIMLWILRFMKQWNHCSRYK